MSLAHFALGEASLAQAASENGKKSPPPKRTTVAASDQKQIPEPR